MPASGRWTRPFWISCGNDPGMGLPEWQSRRHAFAGLAEIAVFMHHRA